MHATRSHFQKTEVCINTRYMIHVICRGWQCVCSLTPCLVDLLILSLGLWSSQTLHPPSLVSAAVKSIRCAILHILAPVCIHTNQATFLHPSKGFVLYFTFTWAYQNHIDHMLNHNPCTCMYNTHLFYYERSALYM